MHQSPTAIFADIIARPVSGLTSAFDHAGESPSRVPKDTVAFDSPSLVYRCGGSAGFGSPHRRTRTGFPFHSPPFSVNTKINSKAPDNFGSDAICSHGNWQAGGGSAADLISRPRVC
jgi:hypothetical protein